MQELWYDLTQAGWKANLELAFMVAFRLIAWAIVAYVVLHFVDKYW